jgi:peptidyl-prolyl cis-trans isomerase D
MALINTLRNKMGKFVVVVIAVAILSFVLADMLGPNSTLFGGSQNEVGEISGNTIMFQEYQEAIDEREQEFALYTGRQPSQQQASTIREQAWELLINRYAFQEQYDALGITVPEDEEWDLVQGRNIDPTVQSLFRNPQTGQFDREQLISFLQNMESYPAQYQVLWNTVRNNLVPGRKRLKYENMLVNSAFGTTAEAERSYHIQNDVAEVKYLYVPYPTISDSEVAVSDSELRSYYSDHQQEFETDAMRSLKFVSYPIIPSSSDSLYVKEEVDDLVNTFREVEDDSLFAERQSDGLDFFQTYNAQTLPVYLKPMADSLQEGNVYGPYLTPSGYSLYKVSKLYEDTTLYDVARVVRNIIASDETRNIAARDADLFASQATDIESFDQLAEEKGLVAIPATGLGKNDRRVMGLGDARELVQWLFRDASVGSVSDDLEINDQYVIAVMTEDIPEGTIPFAKVQEDIRQKVANEKKADLIIGKLEGSTGSLDEIAAAYGENASVYEASDLRMDANILPNVGFDPRAVGIVFSQESGERTKPFAGESGVLILETLNIVEAPEIADYNAFRQQVESTEQTRTAQNIADAIKDNADIVDNRYKFY